MTASAFDLPDHLTAKANPALIARDEQHFATIAESLEQTIVELSRRLDATRKAPGRLGQEAMERDMEVHRLTARLRSLRRFGLDLCLGHIVGADNPEPVYIGRLGLVDGVGNQLIDWRTPAAEPYFGATHADPMGLARRRRYRWTRGRISDYWDEVFTPDGFEGHAALDDQSAFIASLGGNRSPRIWSAWMVASTSRMFVGPHQPYLAYVSDVLPSLGEEGVQTATLRDLVAEGATATVETDPDVARLKSSANVVQAIEAAVKFYEQPPTTPMTVATEWSDIPLSPADWAEAFEAPEPGTPHNDAREQIWELLLTILMDKSASDVPAAELRKSLLRNDELRTTLDNAWTLIEAAELVGDLWSVPAYLRKCAPWLSPEEIRKLQRADAQRWTASDLPLLDAARHRLGDPEASRRQRRRVAAAAAEREQRAMVVDHLIAGHRDLRREESDTCLEAE